MPSENLQRPAQAPVQQPRQNLMDKDVSVSLNIRTVASWLAVLLLMSASFLAGRYVFPSDGGISLGTSGAAAVVDTESAQEAAEPEPAGSSDSSASANTTELTATPDSSETDEEAPAAEEAAPTESESTASTAAVVTSYSDVKLSFSRVPDFKWFEEDGYGKVTTLWYTIVNDEDGIIKPEKFRIRLEGYDDLEDIKLAAVPGPDKEIAPGETTSHGFDKILQYSNTKTDPSNLKITLELLDEKDQVIATAGQEFNLKS